MNFERCYLYQLGKCYFRGKPMDCCLEKGIECGHYKPMRNFVNSTGFKKDNVEITDQEFKDESYRKWMYCEGYFDIRKLKREGKLKL